MVDTLLILQPNETASLSWENDNFNFPNMIRKGVEADGSCFFNSIMTAIYEPYRCGHLNGVPFPKNMFIRDLREDFSVKLSQKIDAEFEDSPIQYDMLNNGELRELSKTFPTLELKNMKAILKENTMMDNRYNEFISNILDIDLYILDGEKKDIYPLVTDDDLLYKQRDSVVLIYFGMHYELAGVQEVNEEKYMFESDHPFILSIQKRMKDMKK